VICSFTIWPTLASVSIMQLYLMIRDLGWAPFIQT